MATVGAEVVTYADTGLSASTVYSCRDSAHNGGGYSGYSNIASATSGDITRYDQTDPNVIRTGTWTDYASTSAYGGTYGRSLTAGATATVWFSGTKIAWIGMTGGTPGIVDVYLDDVKQTTLDLYSSPAKYQVVLWTSPSLGNGVHHMDLVRNTASLSTEYLVLDAVDIWGQIKAAPTTHPATCLRRPRSQPPAPVGAAPGLPTPRPRPMAAAPSGASTSGAYVVIAFKGTKLDWITMKGTTGGIADIYLDGAATKKATVTSTRVPRSIRRTSGPPARLPTATTPWSVHCNFEHLGRYLTIDAVEVAGTLVAPTRIEENASLSPFTWNPVFTSWPTGTTTSASGGTYRYINIPGAYVSFSFSGVGFQIIAKTAPSYGNLTVTVDGVSQSVSLYSSVTTYKKIVLTKFVTPGTHTVKIARAGTRDNSSPPVTPSTLMPSICSGCRGRASDCRRRQERASTTAWCR